VGSRSAMVENAFTAYALAVFAVLWIGAAWAILVDPGIVDDAWSWLTGLPLVPAIVVWILALPICVGIWAWHADLGPVLTLLVVIGLIVWTSIPVTSVVRRLLAAR